MDLNTRVIQEPRGFIKILTFVFAILAFATTSSFDTATELEIVCSQKEKKLDPMTPMVVKYPIEYPFKFEDTAIVTKTNCTKNAPSIEQYLPMDFSSSAQFYVTVGVLSMLYSVAALAMYLTASKQYETNPLVPMVDLAATAVLAIFWFAGACAWAAGIRDVKTYSNPSYLKNHIGICNTAYCNTRDLGTWTSVHISIIFGFGNILLWVASCWFVYKETYLHQRPQPMPMGGTTMPGGGQAYPGGQPYPGDPQQQQQVAPQQQQTY